MLTRLLFWAVLLPIAMLPMERLSAQAVPPSSGNACLQEGTPDMADLLAQIQRRVSSDGAGSVKLRTLWLEGKKMPPGAVMPVLEEVVCAKVVRLLKAHLTSMESTADAAAVVRVDGTYIANFRSRFAGFPRELRTTFYFDRGITRVVATTM